MKDFKKCNWLRLGVITVLMTVMMSVGVMAATVTIGSYNLTEHTYWKNCSKTEAIQVLNSFSNKTRTSDAVYIYYSTTCGNSINMLPQIYEYNKEHKIMTYAYNNNNGGWPDGMGAYYSPITWPAVFAYHVQSGTGTLTHEMQVIPMTKYTDLIARSGVKGATEQQPAETPVIAHPAKVVFNKTSFVYNGKKQKPAVSVLDSEGNKIAAENYTVTWSGDLKKVGTKTVTVRMKGNYSGTLKKNYVINPKATTFSELKNRTSKKVSVKLKKQSGVSGYQVQYADNAGLKKAKQVTFKSASGTISKLKKGTYYARVRTVQQVSGKKYYSKWSSVKKVKVTK